MYHFIGIKGSGMSALAQIMKRLGYDVQGSDVEKHFFTEEGLHELDIPVYPFSEDNIKDGLIIIRGATFKNDHPEVKKAIELDLQMYSYAEMVGILTKKFKTITVAGCHGKTTTTSMLSHLLKELKGANYLIGDGTGFAEKENEYFVLEACEYQRHFLNYHPTYAIITNIDLDHVDYFKDIDDVIDAYQSYASNAEKMVIACGDDPYTHMLDVETIFYYGLSEDNDILAKNVEYTKEGTSFDVFIEENYYGHYDLPIFGKYMLLDALAAISVCYYERLDIKEVVKCFKTFKGAKRRFQEICVGEDIIIDDYAHHPMEVRATVKAARQKYPDKKIIAIFQPHTFSRTDEFKEELIEEFQKVDETYLLDIHPAREKQEDYPNVTSDLIVDHLEHGHKISIDKAEDLVHHKNAVFLFMSPNDISKLEQDLIKLKEM